MKKILVLLVIVALAFGAFGCATVQSMSCNPSANVITVANAVISFLLPELNILVPGSAAFNAYITAQNIAAGVCVGATELDALIAWLNSSNAKTLQAKAQMKAGPAKAMPFIDPTPLIAWEKGK